MLELKVNGSAQAFDADPSTPVLWVLRDHLGLTGTKFGCGIAACGACTIHMNGAPVRSCSIPASAAAGADIVTIEAAGSDRIGHAVQQAWIRNDVVQCGYCQSGQIMSAIGLLRTNRHPTDADIDAAMSANLCRCGTYGRIRAAIKDAARSLGA